MVALLTKIRNEEEDLVWGRPWGGLGAYKLKNPKGNGKLGNLEARSSNTAAFEVRRCLKNGYAIA